MGYVKTPSSARITNLRISPLTPPLRRAVRVRRTFSVPPEILEPRWRQLSVPEGVLNIAVSEIGLQSTGIVPLVGQGVTAGVPEHVRVGLEP